MGGRAWTFAAALLIGCGPPAEPVTSPAPSSPKVAPAKAATGLGDGAWGEFVSTRFGLKVPLPDGKAWRIDDHAGNWLTATHAASASELVVRSWRDDGPVNRARCEERARSWRKLPERAGADIVEKRAVAVPREFDTRVEVGVVAPVGGKKRGGEELLGFAIAFGGSGRRCFAWAYTTRASGAGAEAVVGERLATMVQGSLEGVVAESELDPKIERAPLLDGPH